MIKKTILLGLYLIMYGRFLTAAGGGGEKEAGYRWTLCGLRALLKAAKDFDTWQLDLPGRV